MPSLYKIPVGRVMLVTRALWSFSIADIVSALPALQRRQLNLLNGILPNTAQAVAGQQQQQALARLGAQQVSENVYRVQPVDPAATYSSALIIFMPKEQAGTIGDLTKLLPIGAGVANGKNQPQQTINNAGGQPTKANPGQNAVLPPNPAPVTPQVPAIAPQPDVPLSPAVTLPAPQNTPANAANAVPLVPVMPSNNAPANDPVVGQISTTNSPATATNTGNQPSGNGTAGLQPPMLAMPAAPQSSKVSGALLEEVIESAATVDKSAKIQETKVALPDMNSFKGESADGVQRSVMRIETPAFGAARGTGPVAQGLAEATTA